MVLWKSCTPKQRGGGGFRNMGGALLRFAKSGATKVGNELVTRGAEAMDNVAQSVMEGKDLQEAVKDEAVKARVDLKRKKDAVASKVGTVRKKLKTSGSQATSNYSKAALSALFD